MHVLLPGAGPLLLSSGAGVSLPDGVPGRGGPLAGTLGVCRQNHVLELCLLPEPNLEEQFDRGLQGAVSTVLLGGRKVKKGGRGKRTEVIVTSSRSPGSLLTPVIPAQSCCGVLLGSTDGRIFPTAEIWEGSAAPSILFIRLRVCSDKQIQQGVRSYIIGLSGDVLYHVTGRERCKQHASGVAVGFMFCGRCEVGFLLCLTYVLQSDLLISSPNSVLV